MDPITAASTAWSIFNTCFKAYQIIAEAVKVKTDARLWQVKIRVELVRFEVWGRTLGFLDEKTGLERNPKQLRDLETSGLGDIMQVESAHDLIKTLLEAIKDELDKFRKTAEKYQLKPVQEKQEQDCEKSEHKSKDRKHGKKPSRLDKLLEAAKDFAKHLTYVVVANGEADKHLKNLTDLNDGLGKLLSLSQRVQYAKAVSSEVLVNYQKRDELDDVLVATKPLPDDKNSATSNLNDRSVLLATARVKQICVEMETSADEEYSDASSFQSVEAPDSRLSAEYLSDYSTPKHAAKDILWPIGHSSYSIRGTKVPVIIEWRLPTPISPGFHIESEELVQRRNLIVQLLHETSILAGARDYRVLDCLGYIEAKGREDQQSVEVIGFISRIPEWAQPSLVTLHTLLRTAFERDEPGGIPPLGVRFTLAKFIANAIYQLQCSHWLHRNLSSHQVVFFNNANGELCLNEPYLIGLQYSRPDDNPKDVGGRPSEGKKANWNELGLYLHPDFSDTSRGRRYRRSDDVYSLGIILFEIAFWEPVEIFRGDGKKAKDVAEQIMHTTRTELGSEAGNIYKDAVLACLEGLRKLGSLPDEDSGPEYDGTYRGEDPEKGLEIDFLWKVLREIEKCRV
jgi:hypothetical protein